MAINKLDNLASITFKGTTILSNTVETVLSLPPTILKAVNKLTAAIGEEITYTITITNLALSSITSLPFRDALPDGCEYIDGSFTLNGTVQDPTLTGNVLTYTIDEIAPLGIAVITFHAKVTG